MSDNLPEHPTDLWHIALNGLPRESTRAKAALDRLHELALPNVNCEHDWQFHYDAATDRILWGCRRCRKTNWQAS